MKLSDAVCVIFATVSTGCLGHSFQAPAPVELHSARAPAEVVQLASQRLTTDGFSIPTQNAVYGVVVGSRTGTVGTQGRLVKCRFPSKAAEWNSAKSTMQVTVVADSAGTGTNVSISAKVVTDYSALPSQYQRQTSVTDCVSTGAVEAELKKLF
jgi:hypothetical protein